MQENELTRMANQIAAFFEAYPRAEALEGIAKHIKSFWDPAHAQAARGSDRHGRRGSVAAGHRRYQPPQSKPANGKGKAKAK